MTQRTRSIARRLAAALSRLGANDGSFRAMWRDPARRREVAYKYREQRACLSPLDNEATRRAKLQPLPYVQPALRWSFYSTAGRNGAVRWHARQVDAGLPAGHRVRS